MSNEKGILFLSANDFKEKSIQVIRKTPEAYVKRGWNVHYVVCRDNSKKGSYFYERKINPLGVNVYRFNKPFEIMLDKIENDTIRTLFNKILSFFIIIKLIRKGVSVLKEEKINVIYGYEVHGVIASRIIRLFYWGKKYKYIHRFMGTWLTKHYNNKDYWRILLNLDHILALRFKSDLCIMTNDGTQGDLALKIFKSKSIINFKFWTNGVDDQKVDKEKINSLKKKMKIDEDNFIFLSVSRLQNWKRVERCIKVFEKIKTNKIKYYIVGDGPEKIELERLVKRLKLEGKIFFVGSITNNEVKTYLNMADFFFSFYDLSNVGNPLLEAIRANKIIFTLDNGDTSSWIKHKENGFIYDSSNIDYENIANDIDALILDNDFRYEIKKNIEKTEKNKLWTWDERMNKEIDVVEDESL